MLLVFHFDIPLVLSNLGNYEAAPKEAPIEICLAVIDFSGKEAPFITSTD